MIRTCAATAVFLSFVATASFAAEETVKTSEPVAAPVAQAGADATASADGRIAREASNYALYHSDVRSLQDVEFTSVADIDAALDAMVSHSPDRFARGWLAYAALVAAQSPDFVDGVRETADYFGRDDVLTGFRNDPAYAPTFNGAASARQAILKSATADASTVRRAGAVVKQRAYSLQKLSWSSAKAGDNTQRINKLNESMLAPRAVNPAVLTALEAARPRGSDELDATRDQELASFWGVFRLGPQSAQAASFGGTIGSLDLTPHPSYRTSIDQALTLAAFAALDAEESAPVGVLLNDPGTYACVETARIQFDGCLAGTHFRYEDPFCIAEHSMNEVAGCLAKIAGR